MGNGASSEVAEDIRNEYPCGEGRDLLYFFVQLSN
jgi:hypothetical protein